MHPPTSPRVRIEVLAVPGCPNAAAVCELVQRVASELGIAADFATVLVEDARTAERHRFLGSPTVRVNGRDVEPFVDARADFGLACRVYRTPAGLSGQPGETVLREALRRASPRESSGR